MYNQVSFSTIFKLLKHGSSLAALNLLACFAAAPKKLLPKITTINFFDVAWIIFSCGHPFIIITCTVEFTD